MRTGGYKIVRRKLYTRLRLVTSVQNHRFMEIFQRDEGIYKINLKNSLNHYWREQTRLKE